MPKLLNKTNLPNYASAPSSPVNGDIYYNTTDHIVYARVNGAWVDLGASGGGSGDITEVVAGNGLTGGATSGSATLNVGAGTGITVNADDVAIDTTVVARKTDKLSAFAATTSAELAGVISDETGSGALVFGTSPTLSQPIINNPRLGYQTTVTSASTLVLTNESAYYQVFTGSVAGQSVQLPDTSTLAVGQSFLISNLSSTDFYIYTSTGYQFRLIIQKLSYLFTCISTSASDQTAWRWQLVGSFTEKQGSGGPVFAVQPEIQNSTLWGRTTLQDSVIISPRMITSAGTSSTLSNTDDGFVRVTGTNTHTLLLGGAVSTGQRYWIRNESTQNVTVNASGGQTVATIPSGQAAEIVCLTNSGTTAADFGVHFLGGSAAGITTSSTDTLTNKTISASNNTITNVGKVYYQASAPSSADEGDIWIDSDDETVTATGPQGPTGATGAAGQDATYIFPINTQTGTSYTLVLSDANKLVERQNASANTITVPLDSSVNFSVGQQVHILQTGAGQTTVAGASGVTINAALGFKLRAQWSGATLVKRAANTWVLIGDCEA